MRIRSELHRLGLRFRKNRVLHAGGMRTCPDVVFPRQRVAIYVDGCFWHRCPEHATDPKSNTGYWGPKLDANARRDRRVDAALTNDGWLVIRVWEHEPPAAAAVRIATQLEVR